LIENCVHYTLRRLECAALAVDPTGLDVQSVIHQQQIGASANRQCAESIGATQQTRWIVRYRIDGTLTKEETK
jgi:hypothetical protein